VDSFNTGFPLTQIYKPQLQQSNSNTRS